MQVRCLSRIRQHSTVHVCVVRQQGDYQTQTSAQLSPCYVKFCSSSNLFLKWHHGWQKFLSVTFSVFQSPAVYKFHRVTSLTASLLNHRVWHKCLTAFLKAVTHLHISVLWAFVVICVVSTARCGCNLAESASAEGSEERGVSKSPLIYQPLPGGAVKRCQQAAGEEEEAGGGGAAEGRQRSRKQAGK